MRTEQEKTQEILEIADGLLKAGKSKYAFGVLCMMASAAFQRFEPDGRKHIPCLTQYFQTCLGEGVPLEAIREVIRIARS